MWEVQNQLYVVRPYLYNLALDLYSDRGWTLFFSVVAQGGKLLVKPWQSSTVSEFTTLGEKVFSSHLKLLGRKKNLSDQILKDPECTPARDTRGFCGFSRGPQCTCGQLWQHRKGCDLEIPPTELFPQPCVE